ncbi:PaaX family transcriptional regulator C-terminal domain-containing protein [Parafrigoribacterium mesophilum]|uniref:PaaX family transcriptional regulator n=1 Tax=Parafrigoribacterium mesophilum TaxID=433646 RepID=UPI0031FC1DCE
MILDDFDARPGSATSLLRTIIGVCLRRVGGWISIADLIRLMDAVGVTAAHTRTAVSRVKSKGILVSSTIDGRPGYALNPDAVPMLERGDRRIFTFRQMADGDPWCLLSFSIPEAQRDVRHQLRKRLGWIGCGVVATGLWICPAFLADEVEEIVADLGLSERATLFIADIPRMTGTMADAAGRWWDLDSLAALHRAFLESQSEPGESVPEERALRLSRRVVPEERALRVSRRVVPEERALRVSRRVVPEERALRVSRRAGASTSEDPRASFSRFIRALDQWRILPYLDPGLPPGALPDDWPGFDSLALFERINAEHAEGAHEFLGALHES